MKKTIILASVATLSLCGCSSFTSPARTKALPDANAVWMDFDALRRGGLLLKTNAGYRVVLEPAPDAALVSTVDSVTKLKLTDKLDAEQSFKVAQSLVELGEVDTTVKALRESLFRINELAVNGYLDKPEVVQLYTNALEAVLKLAQAQANRNDPATKQAEVQSRQLELQSKQTELEILKAKISAPER